jgi:hypothetical protein
MFDVTRAYGLAKIISLCVGSEMVTIKDMGNVYAVEYDDIVPKIGRKEKKNLESLFADTARFNYPLATQLRDRMSLVYAARDVVVRRLNDLLSFYSDPTSQVRFSTKKKPGMMTLYQSIDVIASKSIRELKIGLTYNEGAQLYLDEQDFAIALIGSAYFRHFKPTRDFMLSIIPNPAEINVLSHMQVQEDMNVERLCLLSHLTALSHYAVSLSLIVAERREENVYDHLIFNQMQRTGKQFKPSASGKFALNYCLNLSKSREGIEALNLMRNLFRRGFVRGHPQRVAFALAHFISEPTLDNYLRYIDLHVRGYIEKDKNKRISSLYNESALKECVKYVKYS